MEFKIVTSDKWLEERKKLLSLEKELTKMRDQLAQKRRELPWVKIEKNYLFSSEEGNCELGELFGQKSQLVIYHFMFGANWEDGCKSCSFWTDNFQNLSSHLQARDISFCLASNAPLEKLLSFKKRMGWNTKWVSSFESEFNYDFKVSYTPEDIESGQLDYNFGTSSFKAQELPGLSVFYKNSNGIFHTYSTYSRGLDMLNTAYHIMDLTPKGRDESDLDYPMEWVKHRDRY